MESKNPNYLELDKLLSTIVKCARRAGILMWLDGGTLLGCVREKDYIPWENDFDFATRKHELTREKIEAFSSHVKECGYAFTEFPHHWHIQAVNSECHADISIYEFGEGHYTICKNRGPGNSLLAKGVNTMVRILLDRPLSIREDLNRRRDRWKKRLSLIVRHMPRVLRRLLSYLAYFFEKLNEKYLWQDISNHVPKHLIEEVEIVRFRGVEVYVPARPEQHLLFRFGDDWKIPRRDYDTFKEDGAIAPHIH